MSDPAREALPEDLRWVRPPRQARSRETLDRLLDAAEALVADKGFEDSTVAEVARRAGSSVGAFYARFPDKEALLHGLFERFLEQAVATADDALAPQRWDGAPIARLLPAVARFLVAIFRERRGLICAFVMRSRIDPAFRARQARLGEHLRARLGDLLLARAGEIGHPNPQCAIGFGLAMILAAVESAVLFGELEGRALARPLSDDELAAELARAWLAYLDVTPQPRPSSRP